MKTCLSFLCVFFICCAGLYAQSQNHLTKNQILLTNDGIYCDINGNLQIVDTITYVNGSYIVIQKPICARQCKNCGSNIGPNGRCENPHCNNSGRNGPPEK